MSLYQRLFARLLAHGDDAQHRLYGARKRRLFANLTGTVLEIGPGTGVNLPYYPEGLRLIGVEPNPHMHPYIREQAEAHGHAMEVRATSAAALDLPDASVDAVVSTLVLCSVDDLPGVLTEVRRVLKPGGRFLFIEHVAAPEGSWRRFVQRAIRPAWRPLADGCRPDRCTGDALDDAGFADVRYHRFEVPVPVIWPHIMGEAVKEA